jgi:ABC-type xylose transport system substrate-binding protein
MTARQWKRQHQRCAAAGKVGIILPDTKSSQRWGTDDPKFLKAAFDAAGVQVDIQNAQGRQGRVPDDRDGMISSGVKVLMIVNLDSGTGKAVLDKAKAAGIATIDYDRLTLSGGANYYVSFDNVKVGELQGQGLVDCLTAAKAEKPLSPSSTARPPTTTPPCSRRATTRSSSPSTTRASTSRARTSPVRTGTTPRPARSSSRC